MRANLLNPGLHLEADDIGMDLGDSRPVTIKSIQIEKVGQDQKPLGVIYFEEFERGMCVNKTKRKKLAAMFGNETDLWIGKKIVLYRGETTYQGDVVACINVREFRETK